MAPYTASTPPRNSDIAILRPQLSSWTARLWQIGTTNESFPMLKLGGGIELRRIEDRQLADTLRPFESGLRNVACYLEHTQSDFGPAWSIGTGTIDAKNADFFLGKLMDNRIGPVIGAVIGGSTGRVDLTMGVVR